jgi:hypothetical protein
MNPQDTAEASIDSRRREPYASGASEICRRLILRSGFHERKTNGCCRYNHKS